MPPRLLGAVLLCSGAAGLSYEVVWLRMATHALGSSTAATAITLAVFMGGMALGARAFGRSVDRAARPLWWFAGLELGLAVCAFLVPLAFDAAVELERRVGDDAPAARLALVRGLAAAAVLLVPTALMGGTMPAVARHLATTAVRADRLFVLVYGLHVFGAVAGCLLASFVAIGELGLRGTSAAGAGFNLAAALGALWIGRRSRGSTLVRPVVEESAPSRAVLTRRWAAGLAFGSGFLLLGCEIVFTRTLVMSLSAKVHSFALMLATFLLGLALASVVAAWLPVRRHGRTVLAAVLSLSALALLAARESSLRLAPLLLSAAAGDARVDRSEYLFLVIATCGASLLPVSLCAGTILPVVLRLAAFGTEHTGRAVGRVLSWNTLGSVAGPLVVTWWAVPSVGLLGTLYLAAVAAALGAAAVVAPLLSTWRARSTAALGAAVLSAALALADPRFGGSVELDASLFTEARVEGRAAPSVLYHREGATATVTVTERVHGPTLRLDGFEAAGVPGEGTQSYQYMRLLAHYPMLLRGRAPARTGLVICCGTGTTAGTLALYPLERLDLVELHPEVLECLPWFAAANRDLAQNPRCRRIAEDGRSHLRRTGEQYDVVTLEPMPPQHAGMTQLYSVEFYEDCKRVLRSGGVVCQWLPYHLVDRQQALAIVRAMAEVFDPVQVWEHQKTGVVIGGKDCDLVADAAVFAEARAIGAVRADLAAAGIASFEALVDGFLCSAKTLAAELAPVAPVRDDRPDLEYSVIGFGLDSYSPEEAADIREPFFRGRLQETLHVTGLAGDEQTSLQRSFRASSLARYATYQLAKGDPAAARQLLEDGVREEPALASDPRLAAILRRIRSGSSPPSR